MLWSLGDRTPEPKSVSIYDEAFTVPGPGHVAPNQKR
jgi:hypothetical protein